MYSLCRNKWDSIPIAQNLSDSDLKLRLNMGEWQLRNNFLKLVWHQVLENLRIQKGLRIIALGGENLCEIPGNEHTMAIRRTESTRLLRDRLCAVLEVGGDW